MTMLLVGCGGSSSPISVSLSAARNAVDESLSLGITAAIQNDTSQRGLTWSLLGPGSLSAYSGLSVSYISPSTAIASAEQVTVKATSVADPTKSASITITVNPYPVMPFQNLNSGTVGVPYSEPVELTGGTAPFQWSVYNGGIDTGNYIGGSVPDGLTLNRATGVISGTPVGAGTWYFEESVTDADGAFADIPLSIQVNPPSTARANAVPFLNQPLVPTSVAPGANGLVLRVSGAGFVSGATVDFNGAPLGTSFVDGEHLNAAVPAADVATAKTAAITVVNPTPGGGASNVVYFEVGEPETTVSFVNAPGSPLLMYLPSGLALADFNEDGKPDLAIAANERLYAMLGNGDGSFTSAPDSPIPIPSPPYDNFASPYVGPVAAGDFNHSGHAGLAVGEIFNEAAVILDGFGNGTFATSSAAFAEASGEPISAVETADFNGDGNLDLALFSSLGGISVADLGYGDGAFNAAGNLYAPGLTAAAAASDFNGDGRLDVATTGADGMAVFLGTGDGTFMQANGSPISLGQSLSAIVAGDFNGDGKRDLAVTDYSSNVVYVLLGNGDGTFQPPTTIAVGNEPDAIVAGDFNNDGKLDLAIANYGDETVTLLLGNGDGTFTPASGSPYPVGKNPWAIVAADFNGDGKLDLAVANAAGNGDGSVSILLQQ